MRSRINQLTEKIDQIKSNKSSNPIYPNELIQRNVKRVQEECEARLEAANRQHEATIKRMNDQIEKLHAEKDAITRALHHTPNRDTAHLGRLNILCHRVLAATLFLIYDTHTLYLKNVEIKSTLV